MWAVSYLFQILLLGRAMFVGLGDIEMGDRGMGEGRAKAITVACHQGRASARPQTSTPQDKLSLFVLHVILLKGSLSLSPLSCHFLH